MAEYWVYENWKNNGHRARIHSNTCAHFKIDDEGKPKCCKGSRWIGSFETPELAIEAAKDTRGIVSCCKICIRNII